MAKRLMATINITLPADDPFAAAAIYRHLQPTWDALLEALKGCGAEYHVSMLETQYNPRRGRPRKPRLVPPPDAAA